MRRLPLKFDSRGFRFTQLEREGNYAIYLKSRIGSNWTGYEVIRIRKHAGYSIAGKEIGPGEVYPGNEKWGVDGFSCATYQAALEKLAKLRQATARKASPV